MNENPFRIALVVVIVLTMVMTVYHRISEVFDLAAQTPAKRRLTKTDLLFQFKITLLDIKPAIWRRIQVPDCTLADPHDYIQSALG